MSKFRYRLQRFDCNDKRHLRMAEFRNRIKGIKTLQLCFPDFKSFYIPRTHNEIYNSLAKIVKSFIENFFLLVVVFQSTIYVDHFKFE